MGWKEQLRPASFRGFGFFVSSSQMAGGRRAVQHQYPNREDPYTEDLGRAGRSYQIEGHVIGDDYLEAKKRIIDVFEKKGAGELIHPYFGNLLVQVSSLNISESNKEGAIAVFSVTFLEAGSAKFPKGKDDKGAILSDAANKSLDLVKKDFDDNFSVTGLPDFAVQSSRDLIKKAQELFNNTTKPLSQAAEDIANLSFATRNLVAETNDLIQSPTKLSQRLLDSFQLMEDAINLDDDKTKAYRVFYGFSGDAPVDGSTPSRIQEAKNKKVFENFMKRSSCIKSTLTAITSSYATIDDAHASRKLISDVLDEQIREIEEENPNTDLLQSLIDVNSAIVESLPDPASDLPSIKTIILEDDTNSIVLAYDLNESIDNEQDIIDRNSIRHPGFIEANRELEVIK